MLRRNKQEGFVLVATGVCALVLIGMMGLAVDLGRVYIAKNEAQTFTDLTAIAAARELDGTTEGLNRARAKVTGSTMKWNLNTQTFSAPVIEFSTDATNWSANPGSGAGIRYVRVTSDLTAIGLYFLPAVISGSNARVKTISVAGMQEILSFPPGGPGVMPFAPLAHNAADPNFGFTPGDVITLRWPSSTHGKKFYCPADDAPQWIAQAEQGGSSNRGYIMETSSEAIRQAIEDDVVHYTVALGQTVTMTGGVKATQARSLEDRAAQDTNVTAESYAEYMANPGNGRRIGVVPIVDANDSFRVVGFASVFIYTNYDNGGNKSLCAEYIGPYHLKGGGGHAGSGVVATGVYDLRLMQ